MVEYFRTGDPAEVKLVFDLARDIVRERFVGPKAPRKPRAAKEGLSKKAAAAAAQSNTEESK
jgi:hypothetical protein